MLQEVDIRRQQGRNVDVLHRARALGIKIWALEKLERMMITMFETDTGLQAPHGHNTRSNSTQNSAVMIPRSNRQADLSQLLRNERINGPSDRDPTVAMKEMVIFKGPFIYVHDIDEKQKPIMVREYPKVSNKESGDWPQFRSVSNGRCPFIEEVDEDDRRDAKRDLAKQQKLREREKSVAPQDRPKAEEDSRMQPPKPSTGTRVLANLEDGTNRGATVEPIKQPTLYEMAAPAIEPEHSSKGAQNAFVSRAGQGRMLGSEPVASGLQPSNITSAIRSQMISSTAAAPGAKAGTSKEVHGLQRKVLEKNSGSVSLGQASSHRMTDFHAVVKEDSTTRDGKRANRKLELIEEDTSPNEAKLANQAESTRHKPKGGEKKKTEKRNPKVGYCENCMESFSDFSEVRFILVNEYRLSTKKHASISCHASIAGSLRTMTTGMSLISSSTSLLGHLGMIIIDDVWYGGVDSVIVLCTCFIPLRPLSLHFWRLMIRSPVQSVGGCRWMGLSLLALASSQHFSRHTYRSNISIYMVQLSSALSAECIGLQALHPIWNFLAAFTWRIVCNVDEHKELYEIY
jgi:Dfp1/Him1, central region